MKTAVRHTMLGSCLLALSFLASPVAGYAQSPSLATAGMAPTISPTVAAASTSPISNPMPRIMPPPSNIAAQEIKIPDAPMPFQGASKGTKPDTLADGKVPDSVKDVIKRLNTKTEDVTLDDLNNAREAVAKLDALIDIEKRLVDLDKIRHEREKADRSTLLASAIPDNALRPPPTFMPPPTPPPVNNAVTKSLPPSPAPATAVDVLQIEGSNNHYVALIKDGDSTRQVRAGDHLSDDSVVLSVSKRGVELQRSNKVAHLIEVKDVQAVFGNNP